MTILLIEDEPLIGKQLHKTVQNLEPNAVIDGPLTNVQSIINYLSLHSPNLIIADIQLSDGVSFEAFRQVNIDVPIIFTTAYDEYAIRAFKLNSIDYLLKPIDPDELKAALTKYHRLAEHNVTGFDEQFQQFLTQFTNTSTTSYKRRFTGHYLRQIVSIAQDEVAFFLRNELIYLYTTDGRKLVTDYKTLDELEELIDPGCFFRVNRQSIIQLNAIAGYRPFDGGKLLITLKPPYVTQELIISKEKAGAFRHWIEG